MLDFGSFLILLPYLLKAVGGAIAAILLVYVLWKNLNEAKFAWTRFWYWIPLPFLNKTRRLSRNLGLTEDNGRNWFLSERRLCADFNAYLNSVVYDPEHFDNAQNYLSKVHEGDRTPMGLGGWILISVLVFIEATGFALILAGVVIPGLPDALRPIVAAFLAVMLSLVLVLSTHAAGRELHRHGLIRTARSMWNDDDKQTRQRLYAKGQQLTVEKDTSDDAAEPYQQILNRLDTGGKTRAGIPWISIGATILVLGIAIGAFWVRVYALEQQNICAAFGAPATSSYFPGMSGQNQMPPVVTAQQKVHEDQGTANACTAMWHGSIIAYVLLGLVFVAVQIIGWSMGYNYGFAGAHSKTAWQKWVRFGTKKEYIAWHQNRKDRIRSIAQSHLSALQERLARRVEEDGTLPEQKDAIAESGRRGFEQYLMMLNSDS